MPRKEIQLEFGLSRAVPETAKAAWGARLIFPADLLPDRQGFYNWDTSYADPLKYWLNKDGALRKALAEARRLAKRYALTPESSEQVTLYEDARGIIVGNPNASYGYLYVAAWLKEQCKCGIGDDLQEVSRHAIGCPMGRCDKLPRRRKPDAA